ncbi:DUF6783 domain-containing protein [Blautia glucerasea]
MRACLKNHSCNLHAPLCGIFCRNPFSNMLYNNVIVSIIIYSLVQVCKQ